MTISTSSRGSLCAYSNSGCSCRSNPRCLHRIRACWRFTQEPPTDFFTSTLVCFFILSRIVLRSFLSLLASVRIWVAFRKQSVFRRSTIWSSTLIWTCSESESVTSVTAFGMLSSLPSDAGFKWETFYAG